MTALLDTPLDKKRIGLVLNLYALRQNLDLYCVISVNADQLNPLGRVFWGHLQRLAIEMVTLEICKIYEREKKAYELNSIDGVMAQLKKMDQISFDGNKLNNFVKIYHRSAIEGDQMAQLSEVVKATFDKYNSDLDRFRKARDKKFAHSEYDIIIDSLPSFDIMENLFNFGADFYVLISSAFEGGSPVLIKDERRVKGSILGFLRRIGIKDLKEDMV